MLNQVRQQLEAARDDLKRTVASLQAQLADKTARLDALNVLLADEISGTPSLFPTEQGTSDENQTDKAKEVMKEAGTIGVKPRDITRRLRERGVNVKDTFASNFLWRMKNKTKEVVEVNGRHYWKGNEPTSVSHRI